MRLRSLLLLLVLLLASPGWAQPPCEATTHGKDDLRVKCKGGGSYGVRHNADGTIDEFRHGRSLRTLGLVPTWNAKRLPKQQPAPELDPIPVVLPAGPLADVPAADASTVVMTSGCLWTPRAAAAQGGDSAMLALCTYATTAATNAYVASGVNAELRLAIAQRVEYVETTISADLARFRSTADGHLDSVHALRNQYGADVMTLIGNYPGTCGLGYMMTSVSSAWASAAFNIVERSCAGAYLSYAHEVGHNQGLAHDPANAANPPTRTYAYGYQDPGGTFRTVMSYGGATRVPRFSSASALYNGKPTGTATQDNARALRDNIAVVAAFRSGPTTTRKPSRPVRARVESL